MEQNTLILCLLAGHVFMVSASYNECEPREFQRCGKKFGQVFQNAYKNQTLVDIYCNAYQEFSNCLVSDSDCVGGIIDLLRFMIHQHMVLDNKLGLCTNTDLKPLRKLVQDNKKYLAKITGLKDLDADRFEPCTARKNIECASRYAEDLMNGIDSICVVLARFYECYAKSKTMVCDDKIYKDYVADVTKAGKELVKLMKAFPDYIPC